MKLIRREGGTAMTSDAKSSRIWEIDALRGLCIPGMIAIHLIYDLVNLYGFVDWPYPQWYSLFKNNYGALFVILSGLSVTLGRHCIRRGAEVISFGMVITAVTAAMYRFGMAGRGILIWFGVLHCIGVCMILWPVFRKLPDRALIALSAALILGGWYLRTVRFGSDALMILGLVSKHFASSDYFPLLPNLGYFLAGAVLGRTLYAEKRSLLPRLAGMPVIQPLCAMGRHSLFIYLIHQPVLALGCQTALLLRKLV